MNICPITYEPCGEMLYSKKGLKSLSPSLLNLSPLELSEEELRSEAMFRAYKMSIQGVQPKVSAVLNIKESKFEITDRNGRYILKPQHEFFSELPENEDLTMRLAALIGIDIPLHGLVYSKDNSLTYFIKRFDRKGQKNKIPVEDFAQLSGMSRDTKYNYSMEKLVHIIDKFCTFPAIEKAKLFKLVVFNFLVGNEDNHLKNHSIIIRKDKVELSPAYDLLNTTIVLKGAVEEIALPLMGKKRNLNADILVNYFGKECCNLTDKVIDNILSSIRNTTDQWSNLIKVSFLSENMKKKYNSLLEKRITKLNLNPSP
jgi:serine/threonine-protein kinase HipA